MAQIHININWTKRHCTPTSTTPWSATDRAPFFLCSIRFKWKPQTASFLQWSCFRNYMIFVLFVTQNELCFGKCRWIKAQFSVDCCDSTAVRIFFSSFILLRLHGSNAMYWRTTHKSNIEQILFGSFKCFSCWCIALVKVISIKRRSLRLAKHFLYFTFIRSYMSYIEFVVI